MVSQVLVSVLIPIYNEEGNIRPLFESLARVMDGDPDNDYEVVFIDDRSTDNSFSLLEELVRQNPTRQLRLIRLARNSGSHTAISAGLRYCSGDAAVFIAGDMQCPMENIPRLAAKHREGYPVVWGMRTERQDPLATRILASLFYLVMKCISRYDLNFTNIETCLIGRMVIDHLARINEKNTNLILLIASLGFDQGSIMVQRGNRLSGHSSWTLGRKIKLSLDSLVSFSYLPIRFISYLGILISLSSFLVAAVQVYQKLSGVPKPLGWTFLIVIFLFISGLQILLLGLVGEYLWRVFDQVSSKPIYVIDRLVGFEKK